MGQNIKGHYVAKSLSDGTLYHTLPVSLFESKEFGDITFDLTYKQGTQVVTMNFTYILDQPAPADSIRFASENTVIAGKVEKIYIEPDKKLWKHRYTCSVDVNKFEPFFSDQLPAATIYSKGSTFNYKVKKATWKTYAPIGFKIFKMIKFNEKNL